MVGVGVWFTKLPMVQGDIRDCPGISASLVWISVQVENIVSIKKTIAL